MQIFYPRPEQTECLAVLGQIHQEGRDRALVVMASGLGKTAVAAFDVRRWLKYYPGQVLYLCHQNDILAQARETFESILGSQYSYGYYHGGEKAPIDLDILFSSFQTMRNLRENFNPEQFDYIVVDESHHSEARTYRPTLEYFQPYFLLGLTATPDRKDLKDIRRIYGSEAYSLPLEEALARGFLTPVDYRLLTDEIQALEKIDTPIGKLSIKELNRRLFIPRRDDEIVRLISEKTAYIANPHVFIFVPTIAYADRLAKLMPHATALHTDIPNKEYQEKLLKFRRGEISTILAVDKFNEGIDIPEANVIVFLRSTQSRTIFLQQLGRGLRKTAEKDSVLVLDFVANCERLEMIYNLWQEVRQTQQQLHPGHMDEISTEAITIEAGQVVFTESAKDVLEVIQAVKAGYTREILIYQLRNLSQEIGKIPERRDVDRASQEGKMASAPTYTTYFGSYNDALKAAGFPVNRIVYSDDELIEQLQKLGKKLGRSPTMVEIEELSRKGEMPDSSTYRKRFVSYRQALNLAGFDVTVRDHIDYTSESLLQQLEDLGHELGRIPSRTDVDNASKQGKTAAGKTLEVRFGNFQNALKAAFGIGGKTRVPPYTDKEFLLQKLRDLGEKLGRCPGWDDVYNTCKKGEIPSGNVYQRHFGSFTNALRAAGFEPNKPYSKEALIQQLIDLTEEIGHTPKAREIDKASKAGKCASSWTFNSGAGRRIRG